MTTDEGDTVFDPFVGTGTTAVAAKRLGRKYIGVDIDPQYIRITEKNWDKPMKQKLVIAMFQSILAKLEP